MRICYLAQFFNRPDEAGAGRHYAFATEWAKLGHEVTVITGQQNYRTGSNESASLRPREESVDGVRVVRTYVYSAYKGSFKKRYLNFGSFLASSVSAALREPRPDIVFASSPPLTVAVAGETISRLRRVPLVADVRDLWPESAIALGVVRPGRFTAAASRIARRIYRRASRIVAVTEGIEAGLVDQGVPAAKILRVTNGVDVGLYDSPPAPDALRAELGLNDRFLCVYVGGQGILHDVGTLVEAASHLQGTSAHFLLIGQGDDRSRLEEKIRSESIGNVTFLDPIPKSRVPGVIASADCATYSLRNDPFFQGTFPNKNFDYLAAARPVVLAVEGESAGLVRNAGAGIVTRPGDGEALAGGIRELMGLSPEERSRMGEAGRTYVLKHYRRVDLAVGLERALSDVVGESSRAGDDARERGAA